jgi:ABC-type nitrate/sulfonate/bicarbonate transport system permease component
MEAIGVFLKIWQGYDLTVNLLSSIGAVYVSIIVSVFAALILLKSGGSENRFVTKTFALLKKILRFFPFILLGVFFLFIFPGSEFVEYLFLIVYSFVFLVIKILSPGLVKEEYITAAKSLGKSKKEIIRSVIVKALQPALLKSVLKLHINLWTMLIALEFFKEGLGIGSVFSLMVETDDLPGFLFLTFFLIVIIGFGSFIISLIQKKFYFWE